MKKSVFFYKELTAAEVGNAKTHEIYIRFPNNFDYETFFNGIATQNDNVIEATVEAYDLTESRETPEVVSLRFVYFFNSNQEKRMPSLGPLFKEDNVEEGDVVSLESRTINGDTKYYIKFHKKGTIQISPSSIFFSNIEIEDNKYYHKSLGQKCSCQVIYYGAPGTGKSFKGKKQTGEIDENNQEVEKKNVFRTTFHPDTDYASFVGCYKPTMKPTGQSRIINNKQEPIEEISYEFIPQVFTDAYVYAYNNPKEATYLVIEEINRGNCAQIFGDLFQLLDRKDNGTSEYAIKADKDLAKYLRAALGKEREGIKEDKLRLPANLHILATMNTSDQSLFPMDSAFKRRWEWEYVPISYTEEKSSKFRITIGDKEYKWVDFIKAVNEKIYGITKSEDKQLGNFFIKGDIGAEQFKSKVMFYLWNEVLRDEVENPKYFFYSGKDNNRRKFSFNELFDADSSELLQGFMDFLDVKVVE